MKKELTTSQQEELLAIIKARFEKNMQRHLGIEWVNVEKRLRANPGKLWILDDMETTGGEPDVVGFDTETNEYLFYDCSAESPKGRSTLSFKHF